MNPLNRRSFMKVGAAGLALGTLAPVLRNPFFQRSLLAAGGVPGSTKKMLIIFMRGGDDSVNTVIPHGDSSYNTTNRPTLYIPPGTSLPLNGFAELHPALQKLHEVYLAGDLAVMHRIGYANQSRSHFESQQFWENGEPGNESNKTGWANRLIDVQSGLLGHPLPASSNTGQHQLLFQGNRVLAHIPNLATYTIGTSAADVKLLGALPTGGDSGSGLLGIYSQPPDGTAYDATVRNTGLMLGANLDHLLSLGINPASYVPYGGATYPTSGAPEGFSSSSAFTFFQRLKDAVQLLKETDCRVAGVQLDGFDTHSNQGAATGAHAERLSVIGHGMRSVFLDLQEPTSIWNDTVVVTLTEFGRTSEENQSEGTDHGEASAVFVAGGAVNNGVYNCDASTWAQGDMFSTSNDRYVARRTDFRAVLAEIIDRHFDLPGQLNTIIPGWSGLTGSTYNYLNFLT
ncbi:MAG: DUF1501 domain-containing protein [Planctomycetota bacterium]